MEDQGDKETELWRIRETERRSQGGSGRQKDGAREDQGTRDGAKEDQGIRKTEL